MNQREEILANKNDLDETTFCYHLFVEGLFNSNKLSAIIEKARNLQRSGLLDNDLIQTIKWIVSCTNQCFISHNDKDDLYFIKNYTPSLETDWYEIWSNQLKTVVNS